MESNHRQIKNKTANLLHACRIFSLSCSHYVVIEIECTSILGHPILALDEHCMISQLIISQSPRCFKQGSTKPLLPWSLATGDWPLFKSPCRHQHWGKPLEYVSPRCWCKILVGCQLPRSTRHNKTERQLPTITRSLQWFNLGGDKTSQHWFL